jgi:hypothetical protein
LLGGGLGIVAALAPRLPPSVLQPLSILWLVGALALAILLFRGLRSKIGRAGASAVLALIGAVPVAATAVEWRGALGTYLPCHRNYGWLPSYLLRSSPMGAVHFEVGGVRVKVCYGRPSLRGRRMLGGPAVPYGHLWRTGANEPTTIRAAGPIMVAGFPVREGGASLYTVPGPETWEIIVNRATSQWGIESEYTEAVRAQELGRTILKPDSLESPVEQLTILPVEQPDGSVNLTLQWDHTRIRVPVARLNP